MKAIRLFCIFFLICFSIRLQANHLVGGEFKITYVSSNEYDIELLVYSDANALAEGNLQDASVNVSTFDKASNLRLETFKLNLVNTAFVPYTNASCAAGLSTKILTYRLRTALSASNYKNAGGYYISWERCCRNASISNIANPAAEGTVIYAEFPAVVKNGLPYINSLPAFRPFPPDYLCTGTLYQYSLAATDKDGDQLAYELAEPLTGITSQSTPVISQSSAKPYSKVNWLPNYGPGQMIQGIPPISINPVTGLLSVRPTNAGLYVFAVICAEYRGGIKIGEVRRDLQLKVNACNANQSPVISVRAKGASKDYVPGEILTVTDINNACFPVSFSDPDVGQVVTVKAVPVNFNATVIFTPQGSNTGTVNNAGQLLQTTFCWPDCGINSPNQLYLLDLVVTDNACPTATSTTLRLTFRILPKLNQLPKIRVQGVTSPVTATIGQPLTFKVISTDSVENDFLTVRMKGQGFAADAAGMALNPLSGQGKVTSTFTWTPDCADLSAQGRYKVMFTAQDNSCYRNHADSVQVEIVLGEVTAGGEFLPPNIFTPNNDRYNDFFTLPNLPPDNCGGAFEEVTIYSRWGNEVFSARNRDFAWDGKDAADGVYFYALRFGSKQYKGTLTLTR